MKKSVSYIFIIMIQVSIVGFFFGNIFKENSLVLKYVSTVHNDNLNKIATSVSVLFEAEDAIFIPEIEEELIQELPSLEVVAEEKKEEPKKEEIPEVKEEVIESTPLYSIDASKYIEKKEMGFVVTEDNKNYNLSENEFNVVVAVVAGEFDKNLNDALAVVSVILNRCDSKEWSSWYGTSPYQQVIAKNQFEVYFRNYYLDFMPGGVKYGSEKYKTARQAVLDGINGIRNNDYLSFRSWGWVSGSTGQPYSQKYIVNGGNRYN